MNDVDEVFKKFEINFRFYEINDNLFLFFLIWVYEILFNYNFLKFIEVWKLIMFNI